MSPWKGTFVSKSAATAILLQFIIVRSGVITPNMLAVGAGKQTCRGVFKYSINLDVDAFVSDSASCPGEASGWWSNLQTEGFWELVKE